MTGSVHLIPRNRLKWIPQGLRLAHEYSFFLHDESARALVEYEGANAHTVNFKFKDSKQSKLFKDISKNLGPIAAMRGIGLENYARKVIINQITMAMVADCLHHIYEALRCLEKRKTVVALNLLRKPLTDNLQYLSWMLGDEDDFYQTFSKNSPSGLKPSLLGNKREMIIANALKKTSIDSIISADLINQDLFNKKNPEGLQKLFQHAVHLITDSYPEIKTSEENFNFIFKKYSDDDVYELLYEILPTSLLYLSHVILSLFERMHIPEGGSKKAFDTRSILGLYVLEGGENEVIALDILKSMGDRFCESCNAYLKITRHNAARMIMTETCRCTSCRQVHAFPFSWMFEP